MNARKPTEPRQRPDWTISREITVHGRKVTPGTELSIAGVRGRVKFVQYVKTESGADWIDVQAGSWTRAFRVERIKTVHHRRPAPAGRAPLFG